MPWTTKDAKAKNSSIKSEAEARMWMTVANKTLKTEKAKGTPEAKAEAAAIKAANAAVKEMHRKGGAKKESADPPGLERLQELTINRGVSLNVDRDAGVIRGVKILGLESKNNRHYEPAAIREAKGLYEGRAVNVDHAEGSEPRSYRDRIGRLSEVESREDGLYGNLQINPSHPLAEQLFWDAEHSPENVGLSHDATGKTKRRGGKTVVESITSVRSVDLVAEPATTAGLFEHVDLETEGTHVDALELKEATLAQLKDQRPDLLEELRAELAEAEGTKAMKAELDTLKAKLAEAEKAQAAAKHRDTVMGELKEAKLEEPGEVFLGVLLAEEDGDKRKALIEDRKKLVEAASKAGKAKSSPSNATSGGSDDAGSFDFSRFAESITE